MPAQRKDTVGLVCDIGELAGMFEKSSGLDNFLQTAVNIVAYHMRAAVCSFYIYEEDRQELVLTANQGLSPESIGKVRLKLGEGLVGTALKELRPIREGSARRNPLFKLVPGINEERYEAFLAVPILRGITRVGVLVVQDPVQDYFNENDTRALQAIASQLATVIENANLLIDLHRIQSTVVKEEPPQRDFRFVRGAPASSGCAYGQVALLDAFDPAELPGPADHDPFTLADFERALRKTEAQLEDLQSHMDQRLEDVASLIFNAHLLIVKDHKFSGSMAERIRKGTPPRRAISEVVGEYAQLFSRSANPMLREKVQDVKDLGRRLIQNLRASDDDAVDYRGQVIVAGELLPSDILKMAAQRVEGLLLVSGGVTSHVSILARSIQLPMVIVDDRRFFGLAKGTNLLIDADQGSIFIDPTPDVVEQYRQLSVSRLDADAQAATAQETTSTCDGTRIKICANINMLSELVLAKKLKAEGIGLYRSEFPFIIRNNFPSEEEQVRIYRKISDEMKGKPVVFRTLDIGGDKMLSYFPSMNEANPFLGLRAIRFSLRYKNIFSQQLRALLRAGHDTELRIMFPLVSSVDDFLDAKAVVEECIRELAREGAPHNRTPLLGVMIELPSAVEVVDELAQEADFLSIGSNDLVQYVLAVDRTNEHIAELYVPYHPAVLRSLYRIASAANRHGKPVSLCGEMASDKKMLRFLIGVGIHTLSVEARLIPRVQKAITTLSFKECGEEACKLLKLGRIRDVAAMLDARP